MSAAPDKIEHYEPEFCTGCGADMSACESILVERKQEVEIPPVKPIYIEHRSYQKQCNCCGQNVKSGLPDHLKSSIQYGPSVRSIIGYLSVYQYLPYKRLTSLLQQFWQLPISEGTVQNILNKLTKNASPIYDLIHQKIFNSEVVGSDETGVPIANRKGWFFTWQTDLLTYVVPSFSRGFNTIEKVFPDGLPQSTLVSDCWAAQLKTPTKNKQLCIAHLLRELKNFETALQCNWSRKMSQILKDAIQLKRNLKLSDYRINNAEVQQIENRIDDLLSVDLSHSHKKVRALMKRLTKQRNHLLTFLYKPKVPPDNNSSERAIRNLKIKNKISGCFRSEIGANQFATLRSVVDTACKNSCNIFQAFNSFAAI
jgi:transposase